MRIALRSMLTGLAAAVSAAWAPSTALAVPPMPPTAQSYYKTSDSLLAAAEEGCEQGALDELTDTNSVVILDFGGQLDNLAGTESTNGMVDFTNSQIESIAEEFGAGYFACTDEDTTTLLSLGIGTNNSKGGVSKAGGEAWANVVETVADHVLLEVPDEAQQVDFVGADDLEVGFSSGSSALAWARAYSESAEYAAYIDYGDAAGCPESTHTNGACTGGGSGWDQNTQAEISFNLPVAFNAPEIYYNPPPGAPSNAEQWTQIALYDEQYHGIYLFSLGPLDQNGYEGSNSSSKAWDQLAGQLEAAEKFVDAEMEYSLLI